jgi:hypothetical protein
VRFSFCVVMLDFSLPNPKAQATRPRHNLSSRGFFCD